MCLLAANGCKNHEILQYSPSVKATDWCNLQPCIHLDKVTISQPTSSLIVFILVAISLYVAYHFYTSRQNQKSRYWWSVSLFLGGIGALFAGISFQMFAYQIKCSGNAYCHLTSWWEIAYNILTVWASAALLLAIAYSFLSLKMQLLCKYYGLILGIFYAVICIYGAMLPNQLLVSFECMILFTLPAYLFIILYQLYIYIHKRDSLLIKYLVCWSLLALTFVFYLLYAKSGFTQVLWKKKIWFSENDVLHIMMLLWMFYVLFYLSPYIKDKIISV